MITRLIGLLRIWFLLQVVMPKFPLIVKIGHAYAGIGKVRVICFYNNNN